MRGALLIATLLAGCTSRTSLTKDEILDAVHGRRDALRACRQDGRAVATARLTILPEGTVDRVTVTPPRPDLAAAASCVADALRALRFEPFPGDSVDVELPLPL